MSHEIQTTTFAMVRFRYPSSYPLTDPSYLATRMKRDPEATMMRGNQMRGDVMMKRGGNDDNQAEKDTEKGGKGDEEGHKTMRTRGKTEEV